MHRWLKSGSCSGSSQKRKQDPAETVNVADSEQENFLNEKNFVLDDETKKAVIGHLVELRANLESYFPTTSLENKTVLEWVENPFTTTSMRNLEGPQIDQLLELQQKSSLKTSFAQKSRTEFWASMSSMFPDLASSALRLLVPFISTYLCETGFSVYTSTKTKYRNRLDAEHEMRLQLSDRLPDFRAIANEIQFQPSH